MNEIVATGAISDLAPILAALPDEPATLLLEELPRTRWDHEQRERGLRVEVFDRSVALPAMAHGHVFCSAFHLRWEAAGANAHVCYVGVPCDLPGLAIQNPSSDDDARDVAYYLWGRRVEQPAALGEPAEARVYAELRVPRLLRYPLPGHGARVTLRVREYVDQATSRLTGYRFCGLEETA